MNFKIPFAGRQHEYSDEEIEVVVNAMKFSVPLTQGSNLKLFQNEFCDYVNCRHAFGVSNATAALEMAAQLLLINEGDEVIIPSHTYTSSAYPFLKQGAKIVWADIDLQTRVVNAETIKKCITKNTKAIVVVHLYGFGADMEEILDLATENDLILIEDVAQALGGELNSKKLGTFGHLGVFSFHSHKNISTLGEGGMLITDDENFAKVIPLLRHNGHCDFEFSRDQYWLPAMGNVDMPTLHNSYLWPNNYCLGEVECALGTKMLQRIDAINSEKRRRAIHFINELSNYPELQFHVEDSPRHAYHLLVAMVTDIDRDDFIKSMSNDYGIQCVVQYYPLDRYDLYKKADQGKSNCPKTDLFFDNMVSFPFQHSLAMAELDYILEATKKVVEKLR